MKIPKLVIFSLGFLVNPLLSSSQESIEGLLYLDHSPVRIEYQNGLITSIIRLEELPENVDRLYIGPGLIDNQVNGFIGVSFALGGSDLTLKGVQNATRALWKYGVTSYLPTLTTNNQNLLKKNLEILAQAKKDPGLLGSIPGFHLEGPYISPEDGYRGAHPVKYIRKPDWDEFMKLYTASGGNILQVGVAPEIEGVMEFISKCREKDIVVSLTHHNASTSQIKEAVDRGAQTSTHLGNGMANTIHRRTNPFWPQLSEDRLAITIICDGFHITPEQIRTFYKVKEADKTIITSDITSYGGLPAGTYVTDQGETIEKTPEGLMVYPAENVFYGSAIPLDRGVGHIMKVTGCDLASAIQMASTNPARLYGLDDRGEIKPGMRADLILFSMENFEINIKKTIVSGEVVFSN